MVAKIAAKIFGDEATKTAEKQAVAQQISAAAGIFQAHSMIPFYGPIIAAAYVAMMNATLMANAASAQGIVAHANGGVIDKPTLALMGEIPGSKEIVANENQFTSWADNLTANVLAKERYAQNYQLQAASYVSQARENGFQSGGSQNGLHMHNSLVVTKDSREAAAIINGLVNTYGRRG